MKTSPKRRWVRSPFGFVVYHTKEEVAQIVPKIQRHRQFLLWASMFNNFTMRFWSFSPMYALRLKVPSSGSFSSSVKMAVDPTSGRVIGRLRHQCTCRSFQAGPSECWCCVAVTVTSWPDVPYRCALPLLALSAPSSSCRSKFTI